MMKCLRCQIVLKVSNKAWRILSSLGNHRNWRANSHPPNSKVEIEDLIAVDRVVVRQTIPNLDERIMKPV